MAADNARLAAVNVDGHLMAVTKRCDVVISTRRRGGSHRAIVDAAEQLFLVGGFGATSMDELAETAGVARRTLYNQFANKEEIFRAMLLRVSRQIEDVLPPGIETDGDADNVVRLFARAIVDLHKNAEYPRFLRMVMADSRRFPWIAEEFAAVMDRQTERLTRYLAQQTSLGVLDCRNPRLAAHQLIGMLSDVSLWPSMMGGKRPLISDVDLVEETTGMFLQHYRRRPSRQRRP